MVTGGLGSIVQNSARVITLGLGTIEDDPKFTSPLAGDFSLSEYSPAIGQANPTDAPSIDLYGLPRPSPANSNPDMGAIEHERATPEIFINSAPGNHFKWRMEIPHLLFFLRLSSLLPKWKQLIRMR